MNYFKGFYDLGIVYSRNYYATLDYAPSATVILYNDNEGYCIGYMESALPDGVTAMTEADALAEVVQVQDIDGVWFGDKLTHRWDVVVDG